ncbi:MAG: M14-type cytosolic carboxypeptidase [Candidatus Solibacter sp.]
MTLKPNLARLFVAIFLPLAGHAAARIAWNFEGGSLDRIEQPAPHRFRIFVHGQTDQDGRNRQASWYYFRVDGAPRTTLTLDMVGLPGEYNYQPNRGAITRDTPPVISYDGKTWSHVTDFEYDNAEPHLRLRIRSQQSRFWIAHTPPYTLVDLDRLRRLVRANSAAREQIIGKSVEGRDLLLWTLGTPTAKRNVWLMFRQHAWESGSSWVGDAAVRALLADQQLRDRVQWHILPVADPDGVAQGGVRFNRHGFDLNRNWDVTDPVRMPEIAAQRKAILDWRAAGHSIDFFLSLHNTETNEYLEGPAGPFADSIFAALKQRTAFDPPRPFMPVLPNTARGRANVVQALGAEHIPAFLMEQRIANNPKLGHLPEIADRTTFGRALVETLNAILEP